MADDVRCPFCTSRDDRSAVFVDCTIKTALAVSHYYDEAGRWHMHDPNTTSIVYHCAANHVWRDEKRDRCWCGWTPDVTRTPWPHQDADIPLDIR